MNRFRPAAGQTDLDDDEAGAAVVRALEVDIALIV